MGKLLMVLAVFMSLSSGAQVDITNRAKIVWGEKVKSGRHEALQSVITTVDQKFYVLKSDKKSKHIEEYDRNMKRLRELELPLKIDGEKYSYEGIAYNDNQFLIFYSDLDKKENQNNLYFYTVERKSFKPNFNLKLIGTIDTQSRGLKTMEGYFALDASEDSTKLLIFQGLPQVQDGPEKYSFTVMNADFEVEWKKDIELVYTEELFTIKDIRVASNSDVYVMGKEFKDKKSKRRSADKIHKFHILRYGEKGQKVKDYEITLGANFITDMQFAVLENNDLVVAGFYSTVNNNSINGTFFLKIDGATQLVKETSMKPLTEDFITEGWTEKEEKKAKRKANRKDEDLSLFDFDLRELLIEDDGGVKLLAEQFYIVTRTITTTDANGRMTTRTVYDYHYNDVVIVSIDATGEIEWASKIKKEQKSTNDGGRFSSYALMPIDEVLHFVYMVQAKDFYDKDERKELSRKTRRGTLTLLTTVLSDGEVKEEVLVNNSKEEVYPVPKLSAKVDEQNMILYTVSKKKNEKFARVEFK